jgi:hypothetical protein
MAQVQKYAPAFAHSVLVYDDRAISPAERAIAEKLMKDHPTRFYDRFVFIDLRKAGGRFEGWTFQRGPMSTAYRFWVSHVYGPLSLVRRANSAEVCTALRLHVPVARDEEPPLPDAAQRACLAEYAEARAASTGDTIAWPEPTPPPTPPALAPPH